MASNKYDTSKLSDLQKYVTLENGTEQPFNNKYWNNKEEGIYVDIISMEVLFSSKDKFDSNSGWPSFTKPINNKVITTLKDNSHNMTRIEVRSAKSDAHLGHVFNDGPIDDGGLRYCINSASLKFIPKDKMAENGYEKYLYLFDKNNNHIKQAILLVAVFGEWSIYFPILKVLLMLLMAIVAEILLIQAIKLFHLVFQVMLNQLKLSMIQPKYHMKIFCDFFYKFTTQPN